MSDKLMKVIPAQRRGKIEQILKTKQFVSSSELCDLLSASESTVRRDLELMEENGILERVHGGAILLHHLNAEIMYHQNKLENEDEKTRIAEFACSLIEDNDVVFMNHGTTTTRIAQILAKNTLLNNVTVISSNLGVMNALFESNINFICLGGKLRKQSLSLTGGLTSDNMKNFIANKCFIGVDGIDVKFGCTYYTQEDAFVTTKMIENTHGQVVIVADHNKWGTVSPYSAIPFNKISSLITGTELHKKMSSIFDENDRKLYRV